MERYRHKCASREMRWSRYLPAAVLLAAVVVDLAWPQFDAFPLLAAVSVIAAPMLSLAGTTVSGATARLAGGLLALRESPAFLTRPVLTQIATLGVLTLVAAFLNRMFAREREQLRSRCLSESDGFVFAGQV
ncbi:hypothetical protein [Streptomyces prasinus]